MSNYMSKRISGYTVAAVLLFFFYFLLEFACRVL
jgi:hypothetical protein